MCVCACVCVVEALVLMCMNNAGIVESLKIVTRDKSQQIAKYAFDYATRHERKCVTAIHKANIM